MRNIPAWTRWLLLLVLAGSLGACGDDECDCCGTTIRVPRGDHCGTGACDPYCLGGGNVPCRYRRTCDAGDGGDAALGDVADGGATFDVVDLDR